MNHNPLIKKLIQLEDSEDGSGTAKVKALAERSKFGMVRETPGPDCEGEINKPSERTSVLLLLYERNIPSVNL